MLPAWLLFAIFVGVGVAALRQLSVIPRPLGRGLQALALFSLLIGGGRGPAVDRSQDWAVHDDAVAMAKVDFPAESRMIGLEGQITALRYMQQAEELGSNATGLVANDPVVRYALTVQSVESGYPTYITQEIAGIGELYRFRGEGPLVRVWPLDASVETAPSHTLATPFVDGELLLTGYDLVQLAEAGGPTLEVALYWQPTQPLDAIYKLSLRLQDAAGTPIRWPSGDLVTADRFPLHQVALTNQWRPGEVIRDVHRVRIPSVATETELLVILYDATTVAEVGRVVLPVK